MVDTVVLLLYNQSMFNNNARSVKMQATKTAQIYAMIISTPGITCREISRTLGSKNTSRLICHLVQRNAIKAVEGEGSRSTRYFKGSAPVILRQAAGFRQADINAASVETAEIRALQQQVDWLQEELVNIRKNSKFKLAA
jgi:predicted transcriptional regulator